MKPMGCCLPETILHGPYPKYFSPHIWQNLGYAIQATHPILSHVVEALETVQKLAP